MSNQRARSNCDSFVPQPHLHYYRNGNHRSSSKAENKVTTVCYSIPETIPRLFGNEILVTREVKWEISEQSRKNKPSRILLIQAFHSAGYRERTIFKIAQEIAGEIVRHWRQLRIRLTRYFHGSVRTQRGRVEGKESESWT